MREGTGGSLGAEKYLKATGFSAIERFNRVQSANIGREHLLDVFEKAKKYPGKKEYQRELLKLGFNPKQLLAKSKPSQMDELMAARSVVQRSQFLVDPQDLPLLWSSPWGKFATQLKTFAYKQTQFVKREVLNEMGNGNFKPALRLITAAIAAGEVKQDIKSIIKMKDRDKEGFDRILDDAAAFGSLGLVDDLYSGLGFGKKSIDLFSPIALQAPYDIGAAVLYDLPRGDVKKASKRLAPNIPFIGPTLSEMLKDKPKYRTGKAINRAEYRK
jgi:hypothetical protein